MRPEDVAQVIGLREKLDLFLITVHVAVAIDMELAQSRRMEAFSQIAPGNGPDCSPIKLRIIFRSNRFIPYLPEHLPPE